MGQKQEKIKKIKEFDKVMSKYSKEDREFFKDMGKDSYETSKNAGWKHIEKLTPEKRGFYYGSIIKAIDNSLNQEEREIAIEYWKKLYGSFLQSKEWKEFRKRFLLMNPKCNRCNNFAKVPHHISFAYKSLIEQGFLKPLENYNNFEPLCVDCHIVIEGIDTKKS